MNELSHQTLTAFADADLCSFDLHTLTLDKAQAHQWLRAELLDEWHELNQPDVMQARHQFFNIKHTTADDYQEHWIELNHTQSILCGIRHKGLSSDHPFVQIKPNFVIEHPQQLADIQKATAPLFRVFNPKHLVFWSAKPWCQCPIEAHYVAADASTIIAQPAWPQEHHIELRAVKHHDYYTWYQTMYTELHRDQPDLKNRVQPNDLTLLKQAQHQGLLFFIYYKQHKVGLISAERSPLLGHQGLYFNEILLDKHWRGVGLAKAAQKRFIVQNASKNDVIWGTINANNLPSLNTAYANQRRSVRYECFFPINDLYE